ncbi:MAG: PAS domain S-box protein [Clostridia bacterium]|nr:PAS domain S-box protein [Clostridia bacterium]
MGEGHSESHEIKQGLVMNKDMLDKQSLQLDINEERERSFMLSSLLNGLPGGVAIFKFGEKMECQYYSDGFAKISDRTREEIDELLQQERLLEEVIAPSDMDRFLDKIESSVAVGAPINMTYRYIIKNKGIGWLHVSASKLREEDGYPVYYCIFTNPTDETALYQSIVEDSAIGVFVAERKTKRILYMNERIGQLFGVPQERMKQRINNFERLSKEYEQLSNEEVMSLKEDGYKEFHVVWGEKLHLGINAKAINWNGMDAYILYFTDETGEYEHQRQLQRLIDEVPGGIGIYELRAGKVSLLYLNDAYYRHLGWNRESRKQYMGTNAMEAVHPDDREKFDAAAKKIVDGADHVDVLHRVCNKDGMWIWLKYSAAVVERKGDLIRLYVSFSDCNEMMLTQQKMMKAQMELQANRAMLDAALSSAQVMTWKYDIEKKIITDSGTFGAVFGMPKVILNVPDAFIELGMVHTQSIDDFRWLYAHAGDGKIIQKDICLKSKEKNTFIWERIIFSPVFDSVGECIEAVGTSVDITEQKEREQHYEEQLRLKKLASQGTLATATYNLTKNIVTEYDSSRPELLKIMQDTTVDEMLENIRKNTITIISVTKSDNECIPSANMAALFPNIPANIFSIVSAKFTINPNHVTR